MMRLRLVVVAVLCVLVFSGEALAESRPRFTWNTFQFFWNKQCVMGAEIKTVEQRGKDLFVPYGSGTGLTVRMDGDVVVAVEARFAYTGAPDVSGRMFLRLQDSLVRVGTFRWPDALRQEVEEAFRDMSPQTRTYQNRTSRFERRQEGSNIWVMSLEFVDGN